MLSGCKDYQTSADASIGGNATGAMSHALVKVLNDHPNSLTYGALLYACRNVLKAGYSQIPQFSSGKPINMNEVFCL
jgi:metacaspase-1